MNAVIRFFAVVTCVIQVTTCAFAQEKVETNDSAERLKFMKESTQVYSVTQGTNKFEVIKVQPEAALRWTNPVSGLKDGTLFFWLSDAGRPYVAAQVFQIENGTWLHEFQSLTTEPVNVIRDNRTEWGPTKSGIEWKPVPDVERPATSAPLRLSQMKTIAGRFTASDDFEGKSRWDLRLLAKPLLRYSSDAENIVDGATFAFVHTTDPEVFVLIEAFRENEKSVAWRYALAPMTAYALKVTLDGESIWEKPWTKDPIPKNAPYHISVYKP